MEPQVSLETITPQIAQHMLSKLGHNRPLNKANLAFLTQQMRDGLWKVNNDAITFDINSVMINGQHRLTAVVKTGITIQALVLRYVADDTFEIMDCGRPRRVADVLSIDGHKNTYTLAATLRVVHSYYEGTVPSLKNPTNKEGRQLADYYSNLAASVTWAVSTKSRLLTNTYWAAAHYILSRVSPVGADEFLNRLVSGTDIQNGHPVHLLRRRLEENLSKKAKYPSMHLLAFVIKAWNAERQNKPLGLLRYKYDSDYQEEFPVAI